MKNVRLKYIKKGECRYISHLDTARAFSRAFSRSGLPLWFTEGFNTHFYMSFALALPLYMESECELADIRLFADDYDLTKIAECVNPLLPDGLKIVEAWEALTKFAGIFSAEYSAEIACEAPAATAAALNEFMSSDSISAEKKSKGKTVVQDIKPLVLSFAAKPDGEVCLCEFALRSGSESNLNPFVLLDAAADRCGFATECCDIVKLRTLGRDLTEFR